MCVEKLFVIVFVVISVCVYFDKCILLAEISTFFPGSYILRDKAADLISINDLLLSIPSHSIIKKDIYT